MANPVTPEEYQDVQAARNQIEAVAQNSTTQQTVQFLQLEIKRALGVVDQQNKHLQTMRDAIAASLSEDYQEYRNKYEDAEVAWREQFTSFRTSIDKIEYTLDDSQPAPIPEHDNKMFKERVFNIGVAAQRLKTLQAYYTQSATAAIEFLVKESRSYKILGEDAETRLKIQDKKAAHTIAQQQLTATHEAEQHAIEVAALQDQIALLKQNGGSDNTDDHATPAATEDAEEMERLRNENQSLKQQIAINKGTSDAATQAVTNDDSGKETEFQAKVQELQQQIVGYKSIADAATKKATEDCNKEKRALNAQIHLLKHEISNSNTAATTAAATEDCIEKQKELQAKIGYLKQRLETYDNELAAKIVAVDESNARKQILQGEMDHLRRQIDNRAQSSVGGGNGQCSSPHGPTTQDIQELLSILSTLTTVPAIARNMEDVDRLLEVCRRARGANENPLCNGSQGGSGVGCEIDFTEYIRLFDENHANALRLQNRITHLEDALRDGNVVPDQERVDHVERLLTENLSLWEQLNEIQTNNGTLQDKINTLIIEKGEVQRLLDECRQNAVSNQDYPRNVERIGELETERERLRDDINSLRQQISSLKGELDDAKAKLSDFEETATQQSELTAVSDGALTRLQATIAELEAEITKLKKELDNTDNDESGPPSSSAGSNKGSGSSSGSDDDGSGSDNDPTKIVCLKAEIRDLERTVGLLKPWHIEMMRDMERRKRREARLRRQIAALQGQVADNEEEINRRLDQLLQVAHGREQDHKRQITRIQQDLDDCQAARREARRAARAAAAQNNPAPDLAAAGVDGLHQEIERLTDALETAQNELINSQSDLATTRINLTAAQDESSRHQRNYEDMTDVSAEANRELLAVQNILDEVIIERNRAQDLIEIQENIIARLRQQRDDGAQKPASPINQNAINTLNCKITTLTRQLRECEETRDNPVAIPVDDEALPRARPDATIMQLRKDLRDCREAVPAPAASDPVEDIETLRGQIVDLIEERDLYRSQIRQAETTQGLLTYDIANLRSDLVRANDEARCLKRARNINAPPNVQVLNNRITELERQLSDTQENLRTAQAEHQQVEDDFAEARRELIQTHNGELGRTQTDLNNALALWEAATRRANNYGLDNDLVAELRRQLAAARTEIIRLNRNPTPDQEELARLRAENERIRGLLQDCDGAKTLLRAAQAEVSRLRGILRDLTRRINASVMPGSPANPEDRVDQQEDQPGNTAEDPIVAYYRGELDNHYRTVDDLHIQLAEARRTIAESTNLSEVMSRQIATNERFRVYNESEANHLINTLKARIAVLETQVQNASPGSDPRLWAMINNLRRERDDLHEEIKKLKKDRDEKAKALLNCERMARLNALTPIVDSQKLAECRKTTEGLRKLQTEQDQRLEGFQTANGEQSGKKIEGLKAESQSLKDFIRDQGTEAELNNRADLQKKLEECAKNNKNADYESALAKKDIEIKRLTTRISRQKKRPIKAKPGSGTVTPPGEDVNTQELVIALKEAEHFHILREKDKAAFSKKTKVLKNKIYSLEHKIAEEQAKVASLFSQDLISILRSRYRTRVNNGRLKQLADALEQHVARLSEQPARGRTEAEKAEDVEITHELERAKAKIAEYGEKEKNEAVLVPIIEENNAIANDDENLLTLSPKIRPIVAETLVTNNVNKSTNDLIHTPLESTSSDMAPIYTPEDDCSVGSKSSHNSGFATRSSSKSSVAITFEHPSAATIPPITPEEEARQLENSLHRTHKTNINVKLPSRPSSPPQQDKVNATEQSSKSSFRKSSASAKDKPISVQAQRLAARNAATKSTTTIITPPSHRIRKHKPVKASSTNTNPEIAPKPLKNSTPRKSSPNLEPEPRVTRGRCNTTSASLRIQKAEEKPVMVRDTKGRAPKVPEKPVALRATKESVEGEAEPTRRETRSWKRKLVSVESSLTLKKPAAKKRRYTWADGNLKVQVV